MFGIVINGTHVFNGFIGVESSLVQSPIINCCQMFVFQNKEDAEETCDDIMVSIENDDTVLQVLPVNEIFR